MRDTVERLRQTGVVPVVVVKELKDAEGVLKTLEENGLPVAEITFRTACAADAIELAAKRFPNLLVGAGTVINGEQCRLAIGRGAAFIVGPGFSAEVAEVCRGAEIPYFPGCVTPTELIAALAAGIKVVKFFPAQIYGGLKAIDALGAAFPGVTFIPTGGVDNSNLAEYLKNPKVFACGGSWFFKGDCAAEIQSAVRIVKEVKNA